MYQIFSNLELARTFDQHISYACNLSQSFVEFETSNIWTVVGEWSNSLTDCALWLNGRGVGARWSGDWGSASDSEFFGSCQGYTGDSSNFSQQYKDQMREYFEVQIEVGERVQGWVFWTWKVRNRCFRIPSGCWLKRISQAENADEWSYSKGVAGGWIPSDPTDRLYPNICP